MLTIYRRHLNSCKHRAKGRKHRHCQCPIWVDGILGGKEMRESLQMRDWQRAQDKIREWEAEDRRTSQPTPKATEDAWTEFLADIGARQLHNSTVRKYKLLRRQMEDFAKRYGLRVLADFDLSKVSRFRSEWKDGPRSSAKKLERLRAFFRFAQKRKWVPENPALDLKAPKVTLCPTLPFSRDEMLRILAATDQYKEEMPSHGIENGRRIRGLVLLLRYSGMRIGDAVDFNTDQLEGNRLFLYTQKTGVPVNAILPEFVVATLNATPRVTEKFWFWTGNGKLESIVRSWQTRLRRLFKLANIPDGHAHRFRDTFAVELLLAGVPIERVSILLGHQSVRITEKHYAPWVRSRQEQLEADLTSAWSRDPLVLLQSGVHQRYTEQRDRISPSGSIRKSGARGGSRTHMRKNPRRILSPQRLPFRHPGAGFTNLTNARGSCNTAAPERALPLHNPQERKLPIFRRVIFSRNWPDKK
jgi:integrase/recombinase XerD